MKFIWFNAGLHHIVRVLLILWSLTLFLISFKNSLLFPTEVRTQYGNTSAISTRLDYCWVKLL